MDKRRFQIDYNPEIDCMCLIDRAEDSCIIATKDQVEAMLEWYCTEFNRILV